MPIEFEKLCRQSAEVFHATERRFEIAYADIKNLIERAAKNDRRRARFCVHPNIDEPVQQMFIAHEKGIYIRPHKHVDKDESMLVLEGEADYLTFSNEGTIIDVKHLGSYESGRSFFQTTEPDTYHTIVIRSKWLIFVEVAKGPFIKENTVFASWSPPETNSARGLNFLESQLVSRTKQAE